MGDIYKNVVLIGIWIVAIGGIFLMRKIDLGNKFYWIYSIYSLTIALLFTIYRFLNVS
ncbi:hypothetical protein Heal19_502898 [Lactiplantibacillus plantarum]|nr:hypothetical protein Heal19_502898 [Lactiplantibacillus plantarum]